MKKRTVKTFNTIESAKRYIEEKEISDTAEIKEKIHTDSNRFNVWNYKMYHVVVPVDVYSELAYN